MKVLSLKNRKNRLKQTMIFLAGFSLINLFSYHLEAEDLKFLFNPPVKKIFMKNYKKIINKKTQQCKEGKADACYDLVDIFWNGRGVKSNKEKSVKYYKKACQSDLGYCFKHFESLNISRQKVPPSVIPAIPVDIIENIVQEWIKKLTGLCSQNSGQSCFVLGAILERNNSINPGIYYYSDFRKPKKDKKSAIEYYRKSCDHKYSTGCSKVADLSAREEEKEKLEYYDKACILGDSHGCAQAGQIVINKGSFKSAYKYYKSGCKIYKDQSACYEAEKSFLARGMYLKAEEFALLRTNLIKIAKSGKITKSGKEAINFISQEYSKCSEGYAESCRNIGDFLWLSLLSNKGNPYEISHDIQLDLDWKPERENNKVLYTIFQYYTLSCELGFCIPFMYRTHYSIAKLLSEPFDEEVFNKVRNMFNQLACKNNYFFTCLKLDNKKELSKYALLYCQKGNSESCESILKISPYSPKTKLISKNKSLRNKLESLRLKHLINECEKLDKCDALFYFYRKKGDDKKAVEIREKSCANGSLPACKSLIKSYYKDKIGEKNRILTKLQNIYEWECSNNYDIGACKELGMLYAKNKQKAHKYYIKACQIGWDHNCKDIGHLYLRKGEKEVAKEFFSLACKKGGSIMCMKIGSMYVEGKEVDASPKFASACFERAITLYKKRCEKSRFGWSCMKLAGLYEAGKITKKDLQKANIYYLKACNYGNAESCKKLINEYQKKGGKYLKKADPLFLNLEKKLKYRCKVRKLKEACKELQELYKEKNITAKDTLWIESIFDQDLNKITSKCDSGDSNACNKIGKHYLEKGDIESAFNYHLKVMKTQGLYSTSNYYEIWHEYRKRQLDDFADKLEMAYCLSLSSQDLKTSKYSLITKWDMHIKELSTSDICLLERLCNIKDAEACMSLGNYHLYGKSNFTEASKYYKIACSLKISFCEPAWKHISKKGFKGKEEEFFKSAGVDIKIIKKEAEDKKKEAEDKKKIKEKHHIKFMKEECQKNDWLSCNDLSRYYKKTNKTLSVSFLKQAKNALKNTLTKQKKACLENGISCYEFLYTYSYSHLDTHGYFYGGGHVYGKEHDLKKYIFNSIKKDFQKDIFWEKMKTSCLKHPCDYYEFLVYGYPKIKHVIKTKHEAIENHIFDLNKIVCQKEDRRFADVGPESICEEMGDKYFYGKGFVKDKKRAFELYIISCENDQGKCFLYLEKYKKEGLDTMADAFSHIIEMDLMKSCSGGKYCFDLGIFLWEKGDKEIAVKYLNIEYLENKCNEKSGKECTKLAYLYEKGIGINKNIDKALNHYWTYCNHKKRCVPFAKFYIDYKKEFPPVQKNSNFIYNALLKECDDALDYKEYASRGACLVGAELFKKKMGTVNLEKVYEFDKRAFLSDTNDFGELTLVGAVDYGDYYYKKGYASKAIYFYRMACDYRLEYCGITVTADELTSMIIEETPEYCCCTDIELQEQYKGCMKLATIYSTGSGDVKKDASKAKYYNNINNELKKCLAKEEQHE